MVANLKIILLCSLILVASCVSVSNFHTAQCLGKGKKELGAGLDFGVAEGNVPAITDTTVFVPVIAADFWGRYGILKNLDVEAKYSFPTNLAFGIKYGILNKKVAPIAVGLGYIGGGKWETKLIISGTTAEKTTVRVSDIFVPIYTSLHFVEWFTPYLTPRYTLRMASGRKEKDGAVTKVNTTSHLLGGTFGISFNLGPARLMGEYSYFFGLGDSEASQKQLGFGFGVKF
ncbi:MAG: hypothetical protein ABIK93_04055 [candidate division WOR-3 bacterium]